MSVLINLLLVIVMSSSSFAESTTNPGEEESNVTKKVTIEHNLWDDTKETFDYMVKGSYMQFTEPSSLIALGLGTAVLIPLWNSDKRITNKVMARRKTHWEGIAADMGVAANFPFLSLATYYIGRYRADEKMIKFSQEVTAATTLALIESMLISAIPLHPRPRPDNLSVWETAFRYESSFPSGHAIGWNVITLKTFQYYGFWPALVPGTMAYLSSVERVKTGKHYVTDIFGSTVISFMASEGVRAAANHKNNHPIYQWIFEHDFKVGALHIDNKTVGTVSWTF